MQSFLKLEKYFWFLSQILQWSNTRHFQIHLGVNNWCNDVCVQSLFVLDTIKQQHSKVSNNKTGPLFFRPALDPSCQQKKGKHYWGVNFYTAGGRKSFQFSPILGDILTNCLRDVNYCTKALSHASLTDQKKFLKKLSGSLLTSCTLNDYDQLLFLL